METMKDLSRFFYSNFICSFLRIKYYDQDYRVVSYNYYRMEAPPINEDEMDMLLEWLDRIPFTKGKKNITRDFADGVFVAKMMKLYFPTLVQLHNYPPVNAKNARFSNWKTLNGTFSLTLDKVFKKLRFQIHPNDITGIITAVPGAAERVLFLIYTRVKKHEQETMAAEYTSIEGRNVVDSAESKINSHISAQLALKEDTIQELRSTIEIL